MADVIGTLTGDKEALKSSAEEFIDMLRGADDLTDLTWAGSVAVGGLGGAIGGAGTGLVTGLAAGTVAIPVITTWGGFELSHQFLQAAGQAAPYLGAALGLATGIVINNVPFLGRKEKRTTEFGLDGEALEGSLKGVAAEDLPRIKIKETVECQDRTVGASVGKAAATVLSLTGAFAGAAIGAIAVPVAKVYAHGHELAREFAESVSWNISMWKMRRERRAREEQAPEGEKLEP